MENENQNPKQQLIARLKESNNVLVTVRRNPSVDQLSAAIGLTLLLNALDKHATAVFSGEVPNTLEFLKPEETLEKTTDSLRDFIISLDKAKADKLRYKVEDTMVKIFITPYRTSLSEADLVFGQGDFNVDVVVAIGVSEKEDLDEAITSHGRILHDATVASVNTSANGQLGSINWVDTKASSLSEMLVSVCEALKPDALDAQMATAFLTGIVAETHRFSNEKTSSDTMTISAKLMAAGANQQLVATKLAEAAQSDMAPEKPVGNETEIEIADATQRDGSLEINHNAEHTNSNENSELPEVQPDHEPETEEPSDEGDEKASRLILEPPSMGGTLTANTRTEGLDPSTDPLTLKPVETPLLSHDDEVEEPKDILAPLEKPEEPSKAPLPVPETSEPEEVITEDEPFDLFKQDPALAAPAPPLTSEPLEEEAAPAAPVAPEPKTEAAPVAPETPAPAAPVIDDQTLAELETAVDSPHLDDHQQDNKLPEPEAPSPPVEPAEKATPDAAAALAAAHDAFDAIAADPPEKPKVEEAPKDNAASVEPPSVEIDPTTGLLSYPTNLVPPSDGLPADPTAASVEDPTAPPPVPPPMAMPPLMPPVEPPEDNTLLPPS